MIRGAGMWTAENRGNYERSAARYPSDVTDEEWALIEPHLPPERNRSRREILNAILYVLTTGCQWRQLPKAPAQEHGERLPRRAPPCRVQTLHRFSPLMLIG